MDVHGILYVVIEHRIHFDNLTWTPGAYGGPKGPTLGLMDMPTDGTFEIGKQIMHAVSDYKKRSYKKRR